MNNKERINSVFYHRKPNKCPWAPRIDHWYNMNKKANTLPPRYKDMSLSNLYKDLNATVRIYWGPQYKFNPEADIKENTLPEGALNITTIETPLGKLTAKWQTTSDASYPVELPIKDVSHFRIMEYILKNTEYYYDSDDIPKFEKEFGDSLGILFFGTPHIPFGGLLHSPFQRLILDYLGLEETFYALYDYPRETEKFLKVMEETDDAFFNLIAEVSVPHINIAEHIHCWLISPSIFQKYHIPYYQKRNEQLHRWQKFTTCHIDGYVKNLLPYLKDCGFDALEALTPEPQGDVTIEEIKAALNDRIILLDGIPATHFLPSVSYKELEAFVKKILELFSGAGNIVLGISDELPPGGDIEKVRLVSEMLKAGW